MGRNTRQRGAIRRTLQRAGRPLTPMEIMSEARLEVGRLGIATVYRNVGMLVDENWLSTVEIPGEPARYELSDQPHHHHFRCKRCKMVFGIPCTLGSFAESTPEGFEVDDHDLMLHGTCAKCLP